jgi:hypothetical protein
MKILHPNNTYLLYRPPPLKILRPGLDPFELSIAIENVKNNITINSTTKEGGLKPLTLRKKLNKYYTKVDKDKENILPS